MGISGDGKVVVGSFGDSSGNVRAFRWSPRDSSATLLDCIDANNCEAFGVDADGDTIVGRSERDVNGLNDYAVAWAGTTGTPTWYAHAPDANHSYACAVSADGSVLVGASSRAGITRTAVVWSTSAAQSEPEVMPDTGLELTAAVGVSGDGSTIVGSGTYLPGTGEATGFQWSTSGTVTALGPQDSNSEVFGISSNGAVIVGRAGNESLPARWSGVGGPTFLGSDTGTGFAANADGSVIVGCYGSYCGVAEARPLIWSSDTGSIHLDGALVDLGADFSGWTTNAARDISDDGTIVVGHGRDPGGIFRPWIARLAGTSIAGK